MRCDGGSWLKMEGVSGFGRRRVGEKMLEVFFVGEERDKRFFVVSVGGVQNEGGVRLVSRFEFGVGEGLGREDVG